MLTHNMLIELKNYSQLERGNNHCREITNALVKAQLKKGQKLYRFNRNESDLDVFVFVSWFETLKEGNMSTVLSRGEKDHHNDLFVNHYTSRDILLSTRGSYDNECFFVDEAVAKRRLKRHIKKKLDKHLEKL